MHENDPVPTAPSPSREPPAELLDLSRRHVGEPTAVSDLSWDHGESAVWRVHGRSGTAVVKVHRQRRKFEQEMTAYREWLPLLSGAYSRVPTHATTRPAAGTGVSGVVTPVVLGSRSKYPRGLVLSDVAGDVVETLFDTLSDTASHEPAPREVAAHERAGAFLAALHGLPLNDEDPVPLDRAYEARLLAWTERARGIVDPGVVTNVAGMLEEALPYLAVRKRVRCHRDYTPRNWLLTPDSDLAIIDFEHARPDIRVADLERLWTGLWRRRPDLRDAFLTGYGSDLTHDDLEALRRVAALGGMTTVVWAREHGDALFEEHGWDVLRWLRAVR